jgi:cbb3-type cytochrome oxidase subunit 3
MNVMQWGFLLFTLIGIPGIYFSFNRGNRMERKKHTGSP